MKDEWWIVKLINGDEETVYGEATTKFHDHETVLSIVPHYGVTGGVKESEIVNFPLRNVVSYRRKV